MVNTLHVSSALFGHGWLASLVLVTVHLSPSSRPLVRSEKIGGKHVHKHLNRKEGRKAGGRGRGESELKKTKKKEEIEIRIKKTSYRKTDDGS